jgi:hypothetical protein
MNQGIIHGSSPVSKAHAKSSAPTAHEANAQPLGCSNVRFRTGANPASLPPCNHPHREEYGTEDHEGIHVLRDPQPLKSNVIQKEEAHRLVDRLSADSIWEDPMREIYVREAIEKGLADSEAGRTDAAVRGDMGIIIGQAGRPLVEH